MGGILSSAGFCGLQPLAGCQLQDLGALGLLGAFLATWPLCVGLQLHLLHPHPKKYEKAIGIL